MRKIIVMKLRNTFFGSQNQVQAGYAPLGAPSKPKIIGKLADICGRIGGDLFPVETVRVPKGHLTVYVGQKDGDFHRIPVPVVYFNHPLFGELLMEAEQEFGFQHPGGITIPCGFAQFDRILTRIKAGSPARKHGWRPRNLRR